MEAHVQWDLVAEGFRSDWTDVGAVRMHARVSTRRLPPDAPRIVLVHGIGVSGRYLMPTATRLAQIFRVYVPDLPGFGLSTKPPEILDVPVLVVRGTRDPIVPQRWAEEAARRLPQGRLVVVRGAAHTMNFTSPDELARVVRPFVEWDRQGSITRRAG